MNTPDEIIDKPLVVNLENNYENHFSELLAKCVKRSCALSDMTKSGLVEIARLYSDESVTHLRSLPVSELVFIILDEEFLHNTHS